jgi:hypothetical protein
MKRFLLVPAALLVLVLPAHAQQHQHPQQPAAASTAQGMDGMMGTHMRMMADTAIHRRMMADTTLRAVMQQMNGGKPMQMGLMSTAMQKQTMQQMHARMQAMPAQERQALMARMMQAHQRLIADPEMSRMMMDGMQTQHGGVQPGNTAGGHKH